MFTKGHQPSHKNKITTTDPIRGEDIQKVREYLEGRTRDIALWSVGTNTALRAGDLCALRWEDAEDQDDRIAFVLREKKTGKLRRVVLNAQVTADLRAWRRIPAQRA